MSASLVGSEMCIRDRLSTSGWLSSSTMHGSCHDAAEAGCSWRKRAPRSCLLYTSDAADDM
eukprot:15328436-Alexandrium_andersonii.AAC.1